MACLFLFHLLAWSLGAVILRLTFQPLEVRQRFFAVRFRRALHGLGATFIKMGQIISTRPDIFPPYLIESLQLLQDDVGRFSDYHVRRAFQRELGQQPDAIFAEFDRVPLASASISQVHRAVMRDGRVVAVKVRRPGVAHVVAFDMDLLRVGAWLLERIPAMRIYAPLASVQEFGRAIEAQVDLRIEAQSNRDFQRNFQDDPDIVIPALIPALCGERLLSMDFIDGPKVLDYASIGAAPERLARIGFQTVLNMIFRDGLVHADLHPGNIFIMQDHRVALLDLGLTARLTEKDRLTFAEFFGAWAINDGKTMARLMVEFSPSGPCDDFPEFEKRICAFVDAFAGKQLGEVAVADVIFQITDIMRRHRVRVNAVFTMVNIAIAVTEGLGRQLDPGLDLMSETLRQARGASCLWIAGPKTKQPPHPLGAPDVRLTLVS